LEAIISHIDVFIRDVFVRHGSRSMLLGGLSINEKIAVQFDSPSHTRSLCNVPL
jgi:hypothetical protein